MKPVQASMNISMPATMRKLVEKRARDENFATPTEYIRSLIRADLARHDQEVLDRKLQAGLASGPSVRADEAFWQDRVARLKRSPRRMKKAS